MADTAPAQLACAYAKQIEQIAASIEQFGFNTPILVDKDDQILAGHGRHLGALKLGLAHVPVVRLEHLTEAQRRAFMVTDNRLAELSEWDEEVLALELEELSVIDEPLEITATGLELARIDVLIKARHKPEAEVDPADFPVDPASVEQAARPGDLWLLGRHTTGGKIKRGDEIIAMPVAEILVERLVQVMTAGTARDRAMI